MGSSLFTPLHLVLLLLVLLLLFGAKRLPEIGRSLGTGMREFKDSVSGPGGERADTPHSALPPPVPAAPLAAQPVPAAPVPAAPVLAAPVAAAPVPVAPVAAQPVPVAPEPAPAPATRADTEREAEPVS